MGPHAERIAHNICWLKSRLSLSERVTEANTILCAISQAVHGKQGFGGKLISKAVSALDSGRGGPRLLGPRGRVN
jgi:hypothetical protein